MVKDKLKALIFDNRRASLLISLFAVAQLTLIWHIWNKPLIWDTAIYWAMGKHLFSMGEIGLWENFRPPLLPVIVGALGKIGMPPVGFTRLLALTISLTGVTAMYFMVKDIISERVAYISVAVTIASVTYFEYSSMLLTGIPASFLIFSSVYFTVKERYITAGLLGALAFLTRFPAAVIGPAMILYIAYRYRDNLKSIVLNSGLYSAGFFSLAGVYLFANWYFLGSIFEPFISGVAVPASNADKYLFGLFYFFNGVKTTPLLLALPAGLYLILKKRETSYYPFLIAFAFVYGFFAVFPHKELRFMLMFLPLASVLSAYGIDRILQHDYFARDTVFLALAGLIIIGSFGATVADNRSINTDAVDYYKAHSNISGVVASNDASIMAYGDVSYHALPPAELEGSYENARDTADYISLNSCAWYCTESIENCEGRIDDLEQDVEDRYSKVYQNNGSYCDYSIYEVDE